ALGVITGFAARLRGARRVNWLQDLFPEVALALGFGQRTIAGAMFGATKWLRDRSLRTADINIVLGARMKDRITKIVGSQSSTVEIPNWADGDVLKPTPHEENALRRAWSLTDAFVVSYSGNLGRAHDISTFVEAMVELQRGSDDATGPRVQWLFIGGGQQFEKLKTEVIDRDITNVLFQPYQPRERLAESLSAGDVHLISLRPELEGCIVPSKYYGVAAVGRPAIFVGSADGEIAHMLAQTGAGLTVEQGQGRALAAAILTLAHNPERAEQAGRAARAAFVHDYAFEHALEKWDAVLSGGVVPSMFSLDPSSATLDEAPRVEACE
ncbi:MAG: glycosyltransferase family 4 protein, partial [Pseudomonadota bacterium]